MIPSDDPDMDVTSTRNRSASATAEASSGKIVQSPIRGRRLPLSPGRRLVVDLLHFSRRVPSQAIARDCCFPRLVALRKGGRRGPAIGWAALFIRAFGLLSARRAEVRRLYMPWPWAYIYEHPHPVCRMTVSRRHDGEDRVLFAGIARPDLLSVTELQAAIERRKNDPVETIDHFRRQMAFARLPAPLRRAAWWLTLNVSGRVRAERCGTFGVTNVAAAGAFSLHPPSTGAVTLTYGPVDATGGARVTLVYDHRQLDGMAVAILLRELEDILNGEVADELEALRFNETAVV